MSSATRVVPYDNSEVHRAVIRSADGSVVDVYGPYARRSDAELMCTRRATYNGRTGTVESSPAAWSTDTPTPLPEPTPAPLYEFTPWPKIPRLFRNTTITEKIDGTNAAIAIRLVEPSDTFVEDGGILAVQNDAMVKVWAQSRKRIVTPSADNAGFAAWVWANASELATLLGPGVHFGEWWGAGIQRRYDMTQKAFSLFNTDKHEGTNLDISGVRVDTVPVLYQGPFDSAAIRQALAELKAHGSFAAPGFADPEGICVFHHASRQTFKATLDAQDAGKWEGR